MTVKTNAMRALDQRKIAYTTFTFSPDIHSADGVAAALGLPPSTVYKTLVVVRPRGRALLAIVPGDKELDLRLLARSLGEKSLEMASQRQAESMTGLLVGGISALALLNKGFDVVIDRTALKLEEVLVSAGQRGINLRLRVADLISVTGARAVEATAETNGVKLLAAVSPRWGRAAPAALIALATLFLLVAPAAGCSRPPETPAQLTIFASDDLADLAASLATGFGAEQRAISVTVETVRPRQLAGSVLAGTSDTQSVAIGYLQAPPAVVSQTVFALDAVAVSVALTNPVGALSLAQVRQIYAGRVENWSELGGRDVAVAPLSREEGSETRALFEQWALGDGTRLTRNSLVLSSDQGMVASLESMNGGIGYALLRTLTPNVRPLRLDGEPPSAASIQQGRYPLVLPVAAMTAGPPRGAVDVFVRYLRGRSGQAVIQSAGLVAAR